MLDAFFRLLAEARPGISWTATFAAAIIVIFVFYTGIAMFATLRARDPEQIKVRYKIFSDLLRLFGHRRDR
jgi:hypothetical protein